MKKKTIGSLPALWSPTRVQRAIPLCVSSSASVCSLFSCLPYPVVLRVPFWGAVFVSDCLLWGDPSHTQEPPCNTEFAQEQTPTPAPSPPTTYISSQTFMLLASPPSRPPSLPLADPWRAHHVPSQAQVHHRAVAGGHSGRGATMRRHQCRLSVTFFASSPLVSQSGVFRVTSFCSPKGDPPFAERNMLPHFVPPSAASRCASTKPASPPKRRAESYSAWRCRCVCPLV